MTITPTKFRQNIYKILDKSLKTGENIRIIRGGEVFTLMPPKKNKLDNLKKRKVIIGDPESIINIDWLQEWKQKF